MPASDTFFRDLIRIQTHTHHISTYFYSPIKINILNDTKMIDEMIFAVYYMKIYIDTFTFRLVKTVYYYFLFFLILVKPNVHFVTNSRYWISSI